MRDEALHKIIEAVSKSVMFAIAEMIEANAAAIPMGAAPVHPSIPLSGMASAIKARVAKMPGWLILE